MRTIQEIYDDPKTEPGIKKSLKYFIKHLNRVGTDPSTIKVLNLIAFPLHNDLTIAAEHETYLVTPISIYKARWESIG